MISQPPLLVASADGPREVGPVESAVLAELHTPARRRRQAGRSAYRAGSIGDMCGLAGTAMQQATQALLEADSVLADIVISDHDNLVSQASASAWRGRVDGGTVQRRGAIRPAMATDHR